MTAAYDSELWHDLFAMSGGAAAALAGLIFVAVSLNHEAILEVPALPALAARTLSILIGLLLLSLVALVPGQSRVVLGIEVLVIGAGLAAVVLTTTLRNLGGSELLRWRASLISLAIAAAVPAVIAGGSLICGIGGGLYWLLLELVFGIVVAVYYGWILLIEIRR